MKKALLTKLMLLLCALINIEINAYICERYRVNPD